MLKKRSNIYNSYNDNPATDKIQHVEEKIQCSRCNQSSKLSSARIKIQPRRGVIKHPVSESVTCWICYTSTPSLSRALQVLASSRLSSFIRSASSHLPFCISLRAHKIESRSIFFVKTERRANDSSECRASDLPFETRSPRPVSVLLGGGIPPPRFIESRRVWFGFFRPFGHSPPRCHSDIYRGHLRTTQGFGRDQLTIYPPSTRLGLEWAPTNPIGCLGLYWVVLAISQSAPPSGGINRPTAVGL